MTAARSQRRDTCPENKNFRQCSHRALLREFTHLEYIHVVLLLYDSFWTRSEWYEFQSFHDERLSHHLFFDRDLMRWFLNCILHHWRNKYLSIVLLFTNVFRNFNEWMINKWLELSRSCLDVFNPVQLLILSCSSRSHDESHCHQILNFRTEIQIVQHQKFVSKILIDWSDDMTVFLMI